MTDIHARLTTAIRDCPARYPDDIATAVKTALQPELDQLAALRQVARGYCPHCGRGDAAPTVTDWEQQKQRADEAEGRLAHLQASSEAVGRFLTRTVDERDRLRAVLAEILGQFQPLRPEHNPTGEPVDYRCRVLPYEWDAWQKAAATQATDEPT